MHRIEHVEFEPQQRVHGHEDHVQPGKDTSHKNDHACDDLKCEVGDVCERWEVERLRDERSERKKIRQYFPQTTVDDNMR